MRPTERWLGNRVARRLLGAVLLSALLPIGILGLLTEHNVSAQLYEQSHRRLHQAARATGLDVLGRLQEIETTLLAVGSLSDPVPSGTLHELSSRVLWIARESARTRDAVYGNPPAVTPLSEPERLRLQEGRSVVRSGSDGAAPRATTLYVPIDGSRDRLVAGINRNYLFDISIENTLPPHAEYCVFNARREAIRCSLSNREGLALLMPGARGNRQPGSLEWRSHDVDYLGRHWSFFLEPQFLEHAWTVVLLEPRSIALAPIAHFRVVFPLALLACGLMASLLVLRQIRTRLAPLDALRAGTERVARQDFSQPVVVETEDEFATVATAFNEMANQVDGHLQRLATLIALDRAILSANSIETLGETLSHGIRQLYPDAVSLVWIVPPEYADIARGFCDTGSGEVKTDSAAPRDDEPARWMRQRGLVAIEHHTSSWLEPLRAVGIRTVAWRPLLLEDRWIGAIACGDAAGSDALATNPVLDRLCDQAAQALANAYMLEKNRILAYFDSLTNLPNRLMFHERLEQDLKHAKGRESVAVLLLDLDGFKRINDTLGHSAGDSLLRHVAERLKQGLPEGRLARLGGDEFALRLSRTGEAPAARMAERLLENLRAPFLLEDQELHITTSIGIASCPEDACDLDELVRNADTAMYAVKADGGNGYRFFAPAMHERAASRIKLESDLRQATERKEFRLHYQPVIEISSGRVVAAEALIRWTHPERGSVPPDEFVPIAEESDLIVPIGRWVLEEACSQLARWRDQGLPQLRVAVNVSSRQLASGNVGDLVRQNLMDNHLDPRQLGLELTESLLISTEDDARTELDRIRALGVSISIDDFGTGYSSLNYLKTLPCDQLKIDRSFITNLTQDPQNFALVSAILAMSRSLGLAVVAEGVGDSAELVALRDMGCDYAQGYLVSEPLPADQFARFLREIADQKNTEAEAH